MPEGYARAPVLLLGRDDVEVGGELRLAVQRVLHVDRVVLAVGPEQAEEDGRPADGAELALLLEVLRELEGVRLDLVVDALSLRHAVHEHAVGRLGAARQVDGPALARLHASESRTRRRASYDDSSPRSSTVRRRSRPVYALAEPSPWMSTPPRPAS